MKQGLLMFAVLLAAVVVGSLLGDFSRTVSSIEWMGKTFEVGIDAFTLNLKIFQVTLGFQIHVCVSEILMIIVGLICYPKLRNALGV
ncbi:MAG: DUF4321 domain-containing protein [Oscillospiraceae bacterium]|nr:DUF4321 domain-containing protein [Oscillospiraceae bacterium]